MYLEFIINIQPKTMSIDLSVASDDGLALILLRVPVKELLKTCTQVSPQWNRILSEGYFWRDKMDYDGYHLNWPKMIGISSKSFQMMALKHCFNRNFIKDSWNLYLRNKHSLKLDPRWEADRIIWQEEDNDGGAVPRIEIPPVFLDGQPEMSEEFGKPIIACVATGNQPFIKSIIIKLADEGLTDDIMDNFRPTFVVTEMVANRRDCGSRYQMVCSLEVNDPGDNDGNAEYIAFITNGDDGEFHEERRDDNSRIVCMTITLQFGQWQVEGWNRIQHKFKDYPAGMRYLKLKCSGRDRQYWEGHYGVKLANCSVKALVEKNTE